MNRFLSPAAGRRSRRSLLGLLFSVGILALYVVPAQAVHDEGLFQLDGNAQTSVDWPATTPQAPPFALEDWDLICKAHLSTLIPPGECVAAPGYVFPAGTTTADPSTFRVDPSESATDDILKGGTKDDLDISTWRWASAKPSPPKNDLTHAFAAEYECNTTECAGLGHTGDSILYFGADRFSNSGSANLAFWFFQNRITQKLADGTTDAGPGDVCTLGQGCIFGGTHREGNVSLGGSEPGACGPTPPPGSTCIPGDILVISAFGPHAEINVFEWVGDGNATAPCFTNDCTLEPLFTGGVECSPTLVNDPACAIVNSTSQTSPWTLSQKNAPANNFAPTNFFEGGLNLTELGVDACFSSLLLNSRASAAGDAELHDKVLGQFQRCFPTLATQASTNGSVTPGTAVHDTATVTVSGPNPDDATGTVDFFLCADTVAPFEAPDCSTDGTPAGTDVPLTDTSNPANTHDGISGADSSDVNTVASPLAPGAYCFAAVADLTNYDDPPRATNLTTECFTVAKIPTSTVTTPVDGSGTPTSSIALGQSIFDRAVVTGTAAGDDPTGTVKFFVCGPIAAPATCTTGGTQVGAPPEGETLVSDGDPTTFTSSATSDAFEPSAIGRYCFRGEYGGSTVYEPSSDSGANECFTVTTTSSATSQQNWLPNDHIVIATATGANVAGTLSVTLRSGACDGTAVYTEPLANGGAITAPTTIDTTNGSVPATTFRVTDANEGTYFWRIVFTPDSAFASGFTLCENSVVTVND